MNKRLLGVALIVFPWVTLPVVIGGYAVSAFVLTASGSSESARVIGPAVNLLLGVGGIVAVLGILIGTPVGIYLATRKDAEALKALRAKPRFQGLTDEEMRVVTRPSLGAFVCPTVWALGNKQWLWFLGTFIPFWNLYAWIKLTADGRSIAWERSTETVSQFQRRQTLTAWAIVALLVLAIVSAAVESARSVSRLGSLRPSDETTCAFYGDQDGDGLLTIDEKTSYRTDPDLADTDGDGYSDLQEIQGGYNPNDAKTYSDADGDGLLGPIERTYFQTSDSKADTDGDGVNDLDEVRAGTNPAGPGLLSEVIAARAAEVERGRKRCAEASLQATP